MIPSSAFIRHKNEREKKKKEHLFQKKEIIYYCNSMYNNSLVDTDPQHCTLCFFLVEYNIVHIKALIQDDSAKW